MNKYLSEVEIAPCKLYKETHVRQFIEETRYLIDGVNSRLDKNIRSNYGKFAVHLWPKKTIAEFALPSFEYDRYSGVCKKNTPFDIEIYITTGDSVDRKIAAYNVLETAFIDLPDDVGLNGSSVIEILRNVYKIQQTNL